MHRRAFGAREKLSSSKLKLIVMLMPERDEQASSGSENNSTEVEADNIYIYSQTLQRIDIIHRALASVDLDGSFLQGWSVNVSAIDCQCIAPLHGAEEVAPQYGEISFEHRGVTEYDEITFQNRYHVIIGGLCQRRLPDNVTRLQQQLSWKISPGCTSASPSFSNRRSEYRPTAAESSCAGERVGGAIAAQTAGVSSGPRRAALFVDLSDHGQLLAQAIQPHAETSNILLQPVLPRNVTDLPTTDAVLRDLGATNSTLIILSCTPASARQLLERASTHELLHGGRTPATWLLDEWSSAELLLRGALSGLHGVENVEGLQRMADMGPSGISFVADWDPIHPGFLHDHGAPRNLSDLQSVLLSDTAYALAHAMRAVGGASPAWGSAGALSLPLGEALQRVSFPGATGHVSFVPGGRMRCGGEVWRVRGLPASDGGGPVQRLALLHAGGCGSDKAKAKTHADGRSKIAGDSEVHVSGSPDAARRGSAYHLPAQRGSGEAGGVHTADGGGEGATVTEQRSTMATGSVHGVTAEPGRQSGRRRRLAQEGWWGRDGSERDYGGAVDGSGREKGGGAVTGVAARGMSVLRDMEGGAASADQQRTYWAAREDVRQARPFFKQPVMRPERHQAAHRERARSARGKGWEIEESVYAARKFQCDAHDFCDTLQVEAKRFALEWRHLTSRARFKQLVAHEGDGEGVNEELQKVKQVLRRHYGVLHQAYVHFRCCGAGRDTGAGEDAHLLTQSNFSVLLKECSIVDNRSRHCRQSDCDTMFIALKVPDRVVKEPPNPNGRAMARYELLEMVVRLAAAKYGMGTHGGLAECVDTLCMDISNHLGTAAKLDPNEFRREQLYCEEMDSLFAAHLPFLNVLYRLFKARDKSKQLGLEHWMAVLERANLVGPHTGVYKREAKEIFSVSQMVVVDEAKRARATTLTFVDFLEALARLAQQISPPSEQDLQVYAATLKQRERRNSTDLLWSSQDLAGDDDEKDDSPLSLFDFYSKVDPEDAERIRRASAEVETPSTRPLHVKTATLLNFLIDTFKVQWDASNEVDLVKRTNVMLKMMRAS
ncbi:hypothetical protein CYMTET_11655 [Cymbomonas tetramitiformis]|uniref:Receptor ligand binding region domain-containing protein n=1 Tax=Cymbomonas tetramitiformis TaxID=36881 RepID=A0AAE0LD92_9CHLO|nr:hypothetical protein CYMTET_11655 [Cymbomonas tetramitiformis]